MDSKSTPLISVVIAVRNAEHTLHRTLQSLIQQTMKDFEIILIDGDSSDDTLLVANQFRSAISFLVSEKDDGIADAWNKGVHFARGRWITFLNAGDLLHREHFARAEPMLCEFKKGPAILYCDVLKFNDKNEPTIMIRGQAPTAQRIARGGIGFAHPGSFASINCFEEMGGFDRELRIAIDTDWLLRAFKAGYPFQHFFSVAYMSEGGVSDRHFGRAMREYFICTTKLGMTGELYAKSALILLPAIRKILHAYRSVLRSPFRTIKHGLVGVINCMGDLLPIQWIRCKYFRLLGFKLGPRASIGMGFRFYRTGRIEIGEGSVINRSCLLDNRENIHIGRNVSISRNVSIFTAGHDPESPFFEMNMASVEIEDHVVIFSGATVMPGVRIGEGAVVYSGAVVTQNIEPMTIVGGVPARVITSRNTKPEYALNYPYPLAM